MKRAFPPILLALAALSPAAAETCLRIGVPSGAGAGDEIMAVVREAGKRASLCVETLRAPRNRLPSLALDGAILAEPQPPRTDHPIVLTTPLAVFKGTLYWLPGRQAPSGPQTRIGVILGQEWALRAATERGSEPYEVRDNRQLMQMMAAGRLDGMMLPSISFRHFLPKFPALKTCRSEALVSLPVRVLLKSGHKDAAALDRALADMRRDGTADAIFQRYAP